MVESLMADADNAQQGALAMTSTDGNHPTRVRQWGGYRPAQTRVTGARQAHLKSSKEWNSHLCFSPTPFGIGLSALGAGIWGLPSSDPPVSQTRAGK